MKQSTLKAYDGIGGCQSAPTHQCPSCEFVGKTKRGLGIHHSVQHGQKLSELNREGVTCPQCGKRRQRIADHWGKSSTCSHPKFTHRQHDLITGMLMGDGCVASPKNGFPWMVVQMTNRAFLEWFGDQFGVLATDVRQARTAEDQAKLFSESDYFDKSYKPKPVYEVRLRSHPALSEYRSWYASGEKVFPDDIVLSPAVAKMWYISDGGLAYNQNGACVAKIRADNEEYRPQFVIDLLNQTGVNTQYQPANGAFSLGVKGTRRFLNYIGNPPPGFTYKWAIDNVDVYRELIRDAYSP